MLSDPPRIRLVFVNGYLASGLCAMAKSADGVTSSLAGGLARCRQCSGSSWTRSPSTTMFCGAQQCADVRWGADSPGGRVHLDGLIEILHVSVGLEQPGICHRDT